MFQSYLWNKLTINYLRMNFLMSRYVTYHTWFHPSKLKLQLHRPMQLILGEPKPIFIHLQKYRSIHTKYDDGSINKINEAAAVIRKSNSILVMTGAGLSTPSGIPDFRSPDTGLYANLQKFELPYPEAVFDIDYFMMDPKPFFTLAQDLYPGLHYKPNAGHFFIHLLHLEGKLQKLYTQNIDGLERLAGIPEDKLVESHGTFSSASCTLCGEKHDVNEVKDSIISGKVPIICSKNHCKGKVKPDIVFFGENMPDKFWNFKKDVHLTDVLLVIGTSLEVYPFANIADMVSNAVPRILVNYNTIGSFGERSNDIICRGNLIDTIHLLINVLKWDDKLKCLMGETVISK